MVAVRRFRRVAREWIAAGLGIAALATAVVVYQSETSQRLERLTISAGSPDGLRHQIALRLARAARRGGVALEIVGTTGSEDALDRINRGVLDLALVQGGLEIAGREHVRQVSSLKVEPLHLLVKAELVPPSAETFGLEFLKGRRVNLSEPGSGTYELARDVMAFAALQPASARVKGDYTPTTLSYSALLREEDRAKLPDAVFTVSALPSPVARHLVSRHRYQLVPLRFCEAFSLDTFSRPSVSSPSPQPAEARAAVDRVFVYKCEIPAFTYGVSPPIPPEPLLTFGTHLLLVANERTSASAVSRLLEASFANGPGGPALEPPLVELPPEFDWHAGTLSYRERTKPVLIGDAVDFLEKGTSLAGALIGASFFLWHWYRQRSRRRRDLGFESYMLKVASIEHQALHIELADEIDIKGLLKLRLELYRLKDEALRRFATGELEGEELISGFLTHINDARDHLTRLLLHEREKLEKDAARQGRTIAAVWSETVGKIEPDDSSTSLKDRTLVPRAGES